MSIFSYELCLELLREEAVSRYNNNNDCFVHIRLGDVAIWNPGFDYYDNILMNLDIDNIYISTDTKDHNIIKKLKEKYLNVILCYVCELTQKRRQQT
jgi:hypothetical protein